MKLTTITILSNDADADSAQRIYQQGEPDAVWQATQNLLTNPDNVLTLKVGEINELADHDAQVQTDFARIVLKRWHNDAPRIELTYDWLSERARADRLSNKLDNSKGE